MLNKAQTLILTVIEARLQKILESQKNLDFEKPKKKPEKRGILNTNHYKTWNFKRFLPVKN